MKKKQECYDIVIAGAGPAGIEAALQARRRGLRALLLDREQAGSVIANTMNGKKFYHAYGRNTETPKGLLQFPDKKLGHELVALWREQVKSVSYQQRTTLLSISQNGGMYECTTSLDVFFAQYLLLATGIFSHPLGLSIPGEADNPSVSYVFDYNELPMDKKILVVGGGNSAVETALETALDNEVTLLVRKPVVAATVTERNRAELFHASASGSPLVFFGAELVRLDGTEATMSIAGKSKSTLFDRIYIHIGYEKPSAWLVSLGLAVAANGAPILSDQLETSRKNIFAAGALAGNDSIVESANQAIRIIEHIR